MTAKRIPGHRALIINGNGCNPALIPEHGAGWPQVAGIAAESAACDQAERLFAQGIGHQRHQTVKLEPGGVGVPLELRAQQQVAAEAWKMIRGHLEFAVFGPHTVTQAAGCGAKTIGPPVAKQFGRAWQHHTFHMRLTLVDGHLVPDHALAFGSDGTYPLRITPQDNRNGENR